MSKDRPISVRFFRLDSDREPVREWLKSMTAEARKTVGEDIKTLQYGWPIGMPLARKMDDGLWELRSSLDRGIARTFFTVHGRKIVLLHGFMKKSQKTPANELALAKRRLRKLRS
ncbi:MAG: type II toxin-antitoxin system RelE/ParE family toxin [Woeseiaceae bacterium]|jgi:phage-related protein